MSGSGYYLQGAAISQYNVDTHTHTPLNTNIICSILYTQYCNKATHTQTTNNTSVSLAAWPCRYCRCHTLSETDSALPAFIYIAGKCDFSLPQFPRLFVCIRYSRVFTVCICLQIYPFIKVTESTLVTRETESV